MRRGRTSGFTLIELMVTLAVLAILVMIAAPSFATLIEKSRLRGATDGIVDLLNSSRANAVRLERDINVSVKGTTSWCAGAISASDPATIGDRLVAGATKCDCLASTATCLVNGNKSVVSSSDYSGVTIASVATGISYSSSGVIFDSKFGALDLSALPTNPLMTVNSKSGKFSTQISISPLGQVYVCTPSTSPFVSGYPSC